MPTNTNAVITDTKVRNPFPGLRPFNMDESHLFFGREGQSEEILESLSSKKFVAVIGASGSGKSSLIYCGLVPILYGGFVGKSTSKWSIITSRPGNSPIENLSSALIDRAIEDTEFDDKEIKSKINASVLRSSSFGLVESIKQLYDLEKSNVLVIIDQFEELFRYKSVQKDANKVNESEQFVKLLINAVNESSLPIYIVLTMRSDFIGECSQFHELTDLINESNYLVPQMTREDFRQAIAGPVAVGGAEIDSHLVQQLLNEVGDNPDQLPILQHALMRTWDYWLEYSSKDKPITLADYEAVGKIEKALSEHANEAFDELSEDGKAICESMFKTITEKGNDNRGIRHPTSIKDIATIARVEPQEVIQVIEPFRAAGRSFVTPASHIGLTQNAIIDISHESLMRIWNRLKIWVEEESNAVQMYQRLSEASEMYQLGRTGLWRPPDLQLAVNWRERKKPTLAWAERYNPAFERAMVYLNTSEKEFKAEEENKIKLQKRTLRRTRLFAIVLGSAAIVAIGLTVYSQMLKVEADKQKNYAIEQQQIAEDRRIEADEQRERAQEQEARAIESAEEAERQKQEAQSQEQIATQQRDRAEQQTEIAEQRRQEADTERQRAQENFEMAEAQRKAAEAARQDANRRRMLSISQSMAVKAQQITDDEQLVGVLSYQSYLFNEEYEGPVHNADVYSGLYYALKGLEGQYFNSLKGHEGAVRDLAFVPSTNTFYSTGGDGMVRKWTLTDGQADTSTIVRNEFPNRSIAISPDGNWLACGNDVSTIQLFKIGEQTDFVQLLSGHTRSVLSLAFSNDNKILYSLGNDKQIIAWNLNTFDFEVKAECDQKVNVMKISPDGNLLVVGSKNGNIFVYDINNNFSETTLKLNNNNQITSLGFDDGGTILAAGDNRGNLVLFDFGKREIKSFVAGHRSRIYDIEFNNEGNIVATSSLDGTVKLWEVDNLTNQPVLLKDHESWVLSIAFSPDGRKLITSSDDEERILVWYTKTEYLADKVKNKILRNFTVDEWNTYVADDIDYRKTVPNLK